MPSASVNDKVNQLLFITSSIFILLLSLINIKNYFAEKQVLGVETQSNQAESFWTEFLKANPNYIPGWVELGMNEKASSIDPNNEALIK